MPRCAAAAPAEAPPPAPPCPPTAPRAHAAGQCGAHPHPATHPRPAERPSVRRPAASPSVRAFARELGVDLAQGPQRPQEPHPKADVTAFIKGRHEHRRVRAFPAGGPSHRRAAWAAGLDLLPWPKVDFAKFGEIEVKPLSRIKKISGQNLARNWVMIPAVTYHEDADITDLEAFRVQMNKENEKSGKSSPCSPSSSRPRCARCRSSPSSTAALDGDNLV